MTLCDPWVVIYDQSDRLYQQSDPIYDQSDPKLHQIYAQSDLKIVPKVIPLLLPSRSCSKRLMVRTKWVWSRVPNRSFNAAFGTHKFPKRLSTFILLWDSSSNHFLRLPICKNQREAYLEHPALPRKLFVVSHKRSTLDRTDFSTPKSRQVCGNVRMKFGKLPRFFRAWFSASSVPLQNSSKSCSDGKSSLKCSQCSEMAY